MIILKVLDKVKENKLFFITFGVIILNSVFFIYNNGLASLMEKYYASLYVVDYSCGYSSRLLIGSIFSLFLKDNFSYEVIVLILLIVYFFFCLFFSLIVNKYLKNTDYKHLGLFVVFLAATPFFMGFLDFFGIVDMFWPFIIMFSLWAVDKKGLRWLVPVVCVAGIAIHEYFTVTYMVPCAIMIYHQFAKKPNVSNFIYVAFSAVLLSAASYYFLFVGSETMKMTSDELFDYVKNITNIKGDTYAETYVKAIFFWKEHPTALQSNEPEYITYIKTLISGYTANNKNDIISIFSFILSLCMISSPFAWIFAKSFKSEKSPFKKITYLLSLTPILLGMICQIVSTDDTRFMLHFIVMIIFLLLFMVKEQEEVFIENYTKMTKKATNPLIVVIAMLISKFLVSGVIA